MLTQVDWATGKAGPSRWHRVRHLRDLHAPLFLPGPAGGGFFSVLMFIAALFFIIQVGAFAMGLPGPVHHRVDSRVVHRDEQVRQGDFAHRISVRVKDQLGALADSFNQMTGSIEDLLRQAAEKKAPRGGDAPGSRDPDVAPAARPLQVPAASRSRRVRPGA